MAREDSKLAELIGRIVDTRRAEARINPQWIATEALLELDPGKRSPELVRVGCHMHLRQLARACCRRLFEGAEDEDEPVFEGFRELQWRYPTSHSHDKPEREYVLRDLMSDEDVSYNVARLRSEAHAKLAHADALEDWGRTRPKYA